MRKSAPQRRGREPLHGLKGLYRRLLAMHSALNTAVSHVLQLVHVHAHLRDLRIPTENHPSALHPPPASSASAPSDGPPQHTQSTHGESRDIAQQGRDREYYVFRGWGLTGRRSRALGRRGWIQSLQSLQGLQRRFQERRSVGLNLCRGRSGVLSVIISLAVKYSGSGSV